MDDLSGRRLFWSTAVLLIELAALLVAYDELFGVGDQKTDWVYVVVWPPTTVAFTALGFFVAVTMVWPAALVGRRRILRRPQSARRSSYLLSLSLASGVAAAYSCVVPGGTAESLTVWAGMTLASAIPLHIMVTEKAER